VIEVQENRRSPVDIPVDGVFLEGELIVPEGAAGIVVFAHGSGSSRFSPRNQAVASEIRAAGIGTLLFDLLTRDEEAVDIYTRHLRFDIDLLARRLAAATRWLLQQPGAANVKIGYFGSSTGGGAALVAAAELGSLISAVVSRGGRPDLAGEALPKVTAPTLLIVGELDDVVIALNREAIARMQCRTKLSIVSGATHLFEEPGALEQVAALAAQWFADHFRAEISAAAK
jgi:dienelactone hydrolase